MLPAPPGSDARRARDWLVGIGAELLRLADQSDDRTSAILNKVNVIATLAELDDESVLRVRCFPNVFNLQA